MSNYPQIDYTSRDFLSLVQDMSSLIESRAPEWTDRSSNDFGMVMIELFAYMGDILSYYGDRIANEAFLPTATQRESVLAIAKLLDYYPSGPVAASVGAKFSNSSGSYAWVLKGTQIATKQTSRTTPDPSKPFQIYQLAALAPVTFETVDDVLVPPNGSATVTAVEGLTYNEQAGISTGSSDQDFPLYRLPVIDNSVTVLIGTTKWVYYERLVDAYPTTRAYTLETDGDNVVHVIFGDGANGAIPSVGQTINVTYRVGGGRQGNVAALAITRILSTVPAALHVTNPAAAAGGGEAETTAEIKANAPRSLFTLQRAVSLADYVGLAQRVGGVAKVSVPPPVAYSSVTVYIAPTGGGGVDTSGVPTATFTALKSRVTNYLVDKIPLGTTLTMGDPVYVPVTLQMHIIVKAKYKQEDVRQAAIKRIYQLFAFESVVFGDTISLKDVHTALATVVGIDSVDVTTMARSSPATITVDSFDTALTGTGWTVNTTNKVEGTGSNQHTGTGTGTRTFTAVDLSAATEMQVRGSYAGPSTAYLVSTITLTDVNGATWALGSRTFGANATTTAGNFNSARWPLNWPSDPDVFDAKNVTGYTITTIPKNIPGNVFYLDVLTAYLASATDLSFAVYELPAPFVVGQSTLTVTASNGLLKF